MVPLNSSILQLSTLALEAGEAGLTTLGLAASTEPETTLPKVELFSWSLKRSRLKLVESTALLSKIFLHYIEVGIQLNTERVATLAGRGSKAPRFPAPMVL